MKRALSVALGAMVLTLGPVAAPAMADDNPCKGDGTTSKCRPPYRCEPVIGLPDPTTGQGGYVDIVCSEG